MSTKETIAREEIRAMVRHTRKEIDNLRGMLDDEARFKNYLYYLHGMFSKLEKKMLLLERTEKAE